MCKQSLDLKTILCTQRKVNCTCSQDHSSAEKLKTGECETNINMRCNSDNYLQSMATT